ncbi:hypothetical protein AX17_003213 [Amanita inopinata Kibby_2008]|nr:hypothetical protein AX17_003213 [Amanita inopinata Kibby_2008]
MASQSILRARASRIPAHLNLKPSTTKPILKQSPRPSPLPLSPSPFPFTSAFNSLLSGSARSPHVHFPPSPSLFATYSTHSPITYDRGPIHVSPNPLDLPAWGDRVYSPSIDGFKLSDPPKRRSLKKSNAILEDPRSPLSNANVRFAASLALGSKPRMELGKALSTYPRSPYPSAPISPMENSGNDGGFEVVETRSRSLSCGHADAPVLAPPPRARSIGERNTNHRSVTFQLTSSRRLAPPHLDLSAIQFQEFLLSPVQETTQSEAVLEEHLSGENDENTRLSNAFWESMSIDECGISGSASDTFPESVTGSQASEPEELMPKSPSAPMILFGTSDGALWSPGIPRGPSMPLRESPADEGRTGFTFSNIKRSTIAAPSPNDPFATFPSFSAAMKIVDAKQMIKRPPRAVLP